MHCLREGGGNDGSLERTWGAREQARIADFRRPRLEAIGGAAPAQRLDIGEQRRIGSEGRQALEEQRELAPLRRQVLRREILDGAVAVDKTPGGHFADAVDSWIAVRRVADQREKVGNALRLDAVLGAHGAGVQQLVGAPVHLHYALTAPPLRRKRVLERMKLREQRGLDAFAGLVTGPKSVTERLDDMVGRHANMGGALLDQPQHGMQHAGDRAIRRVLLLEPAQPVEVAEELVRPVDEVGYHESDIIGKRSRRAHRKTTIELPLAKTIQGIASAGCRYHWLPSAFSGLPREPPRSYVSGAVGVLANPLRGDRLGCCVFRLPGLAAPGGLRLRAQYTAAPRAFRQSTRKNVTRP